MNTSTLRAVVDCLIPPDDFPGAYEAGVCAYVMRLFDSDLRHEFEFFSKGLGSIEDEARARFNASFASLTLNQQVTTLEAVERGEVSTSWSISPQRFFEMLVCVTAEGFYSDPQQGGNRGAISWAMTGFEEQASG
jgi:gluconate 2-dehydrogenase gamma chain